LRYAILFSGMTERRSLNGLEFCYRTLIERLGFESGKVHVLNYDGSFTTADEPATEDRTQAVWPGDATQYRLRVTGEGSRKALRAVLETLKQQLTEDDLLFIHTTGHGGDYGDGRGPFLLTYPRRARYRMHDFCDDLALLPRHRSLLVLMAQCFSTGFNRAIVEASRARQTFIASASTGYSYAMEDDLNWDAFERNWIAALGGYDVNGAAIAGGTGRRRGGRITAQEIFGYASTCPDRNPRDSPEFAARPDSAAEMTMTERASAGPPAA
jgi:hypothetical protein